VDDYSEFPTTPTAWQEIDDFPVEAPPPAPARRGVDLIALVPGVAFVLLAVVVLVGASLPLTLFQNGGVLWGLLVAAGVLMLSSELRKARRRR
jgi:pantothenate kinase type III